jgi:uncharacterized protein
VKRLFLDANVLFQAAHNPGGKAAFIISLGNEGFWELYTNTHAIEEARRNIELKSPQSIHRLIQIIKRIERAPSTTLEHCPIELPDKDKPIMNSAVGCSATHLITLDRKHFGKYMNKPRYTAGIIIQHIEDFLEGL